MKFIYPEKNTTLKFNNLGSKLIECRTTGSLLPNMRWVHVSANNSKKIVDVVRRVYTVFASTGRSTYVLQLNFVRPIPHIDAGEYVCIVSNEWETVNQSITIAFELLRGSKL